MQILFSSASPRHLPVSTRSLFVPLLIPAMPERCSRGSAKYSSRRKSHFRLRYSRSLLFFCIPAFHARTSFACRQVLTKAPHSFALPVSSDRQTWPRFRFSRILRVAKIQLE